MPLGLRSRLAFVAAAPIACLAVDTATAVDVQATCTPGPCNTWQAANVRLVWTPAPGSFFVDGECNPTPPPFTAEGATPRACTVTDGAPIAPQTVKREVTILIDKTAPKVTGAAPSVAPNGLGWHTGPVAFTFGGTDASQANATSGIVSCSQVGYGGPDTATGSVQGTCRDGAGNVSAPFTHAFKYDATTPVLAPLAADADDRVVTLRWMRSEGPIELARTPGIGDEPTSVVYRGAAESFVDRTVKNGTTYRYQATVTDAAGNAAAQSIAARPFRGLEAPAEGARLAAPPRLTWTKVQNAAYYNVQVYRGGKKILSVWPKSTTFALKRSWRYQGTRYRAAPGTYRVFVWPGIGPFAKQRYGRIVGSRTFVVVRG